MGFKGMKKNKTLLSLSLLVLLSFNYLHIVRATYAIGVSEGDEMIYEIATVDEDGLETIFGRSWVMIFGERSVEGAKCKYIVRKIIKETYGWVIDMNYWDWTAGEFNVEPDVIGLQARVSEDPLVASAKTISLIVPLTVESYLRIRYDRNINADVQNNGVSIYDTYRFEADYGENTGVMTSLRYVYLGDTVWEMRQSTSIPSFSPLIIFLVSITAIIGMIGIMIKQRKIIFN